MNIYILYIYINSKNFDKDLTRLILFQYEMFFDSQILVLLSVELFIVHFSLNNFFYKYIRIAAFSIKCYANTDIFSLYICPFSNK